MLFSMKKDIKRTPLLSRVIPSGYFIVCLSCLCKQAPHGLRLISFRTIWSLAYNQYAFRNTKYFSNTVVKWNISKFKKNYLKKKCSCFVLTKFIRTILIKMKDGWRKCIIKLLFGCRWKCYEKQNKF